MSKFISEHKENIILEIGYDRPCNYIFMQIIDKNEESYIYSNINDMEIDFINHRDIDYFINKAKNEFNIEIPKEHIINVLCEANNKLNLCDIEKEIVDEFIMFQDDIEFINSVKNFIQGY